MICYNQYETRSDIIWAGWFCSYDFAKIFHVFFANPKHACIKPFITKEHVRAHFRVLKDKPPTGIIFAGGYRIVIIPLPSNMSGTALYVRERIFWDNLFFYQTCNQFHLVFWIRHGYIHWSPRIAYSVWINTLHAHTLN